jgi:hypothetical protein
VQQRARTEARARQIFIGGLASTTTREEVRQLFEAYGEVEHVPYSQNIRTRLPTGSYASTIAVLRLVFLSTIPDTHRQYGWKAAGEK